MTRRAALLLPWCEQAAISLHVRLDPVEAERIMRTGMAVVAQIEGAR